MKTYTKTELAAILTAHSLWQATDGQEGTRANLRGADLHAANLRGANLGEADLGEADLGEANLRRADLREADLGAANLHGANLRWANLRWADLGAANLRWADLREADLGAANLRWADLREADLREADLGAANLITGQFHCWNYYAQAETLRIGCHVHDWADWKAHGKAYARSNDCLPDFVAFWPALETMRKILVKRASAKGAGRG